MRPAEDAKPELDDAVRQRPRAPRGFVAWVERALESVPWIRRKIPDRALADFFRKMQTMLSAGLRIDQAQRSAMPSSGPLRDPLESVLRRLRRGDEWAESLRATGAFPPLVVELVSAAEAAGAVAEVCGFLADQFERRIRHRRQLIQRLTWPITQLILAVLILTVVIFVLGIVAETTGSQPIDILGLGLSGAGGAMIFLLSIVGTFVLGWAAYVGVTRGLGRKVEVHRLLLTLPISRAVLLNLALARFSWAFHLTAEAGSPIDKGLALSLRATNNPAFAAVVPQVSEGIAEGNEVTETLSATSLFPPEFLEQIQVGELSGTLAETMGRLADEHWQRGEHALSRFLWIVSILAWMAVSALIILAIFRLFSFYLNMLNSFL